MSALELILIVLCLLGSWFFSGIETGLISINRLRLRHFIRRKIPGATTLQHFLDHPDELLGTTLVGNNIVNTVLAVMAASIGTRWLGASGAWVSSALATVIILVFCEYFPKAWFQSFPAKRCLPFARVLWFIRGVLRPLGIVLMTVVRYVVPGPPKPVDDGAQPAITREELLHLTREGRESGVFTAEEVRMIDGVMDLKAITCEEIMIPRDKMLYVHHDTSVDDIKLFARAREFNNFPVLHKERKEFVGIVYIFDVLADENPAGKTAQDYMRPPQLVSRGTPVDHVLPRMRVTRQPMVLVTDDERKNVIGLVTLELVVAEFVGT